MVQIGERLCAFPITHVSETMRAPKTTDLSSPFPFISGAAIVRGDAILVVDGRKLLGQAESAVARMVILKAGARKFGLTVDSVDGIVEIQDEQDGRELAPLLTQAAGDWVERLVKLDNALVTVLASGRLVPEVAWESLRETGQHG